MSLYHLYPTAAGWTVEKLAPEQMFRQETQPAPVPAPAPDDEFEPITAFSRRAIDLLVAAYETDLERWLLANGIDGPEWPHYDLLFDLQDEAAAWQPYRPACCGR